MSFEGNCEGLSEELGNAEAPWYLAYTRPRMENRALLNLERQGFETYLPLFKSCRRTMDGYQSTFKPMFSRYVFLRPGDHRQSISTVPSTRGVCGLVNFCGQAAQVPLHTIEAIRKFEWQRNQADLDSMSPIQPGAWVRACKDGMKGIEGLVVSVAKQRVTFLLQLLGRETQVTVAHAQLELA